MKTVKDRLAKQPIISIPNGINRLLPIPEPLDMYWSFIFQGNAQLNTTTHTGHPAGLQEWREFAEYFAEQFGGKVVWED